MEFTNKKTIPIKCWKMHFLAVICSYTSPYSYDNKYYIGIYIELDFTKYLITVFDEILERERDNNGDIIVEL